MQRYHKILFGLIMTVMLISPMAKVPIDLFGFTIMPLRGHIEYAEYPEFTIESFFDGSFQEAYENYLEDHIGLRNIFVRLNNQIDFSLYQKPANPGIIVGKDKYLYERDYIDAYCGKNFVGQKVIDAQCDRIKAIQDTLVKLEIEFFIVMAPGKASMFPEFIPDQYLEDTFGITNNVAYLEGFQERGINHIDFNSLFYCMKDTSRFPLYHKCGIHWNQYGALFALDSIISYIEAARNIDMTDIRYEAIELSEKPRGTDYDVGDALNLFFRIPDQAMPYPTKLMYDTKGKVKPSIMVIADSYYYTIFDLCENRNIWNKHDFRFYDEIMFNWNHDIKKLPNATIDELKKFDVIMILYSEMNMHMLSNRFIERAYARFYETWWLDQIKDRIRKDKNWLKNIEDKAAMKGNTLDEQIDLDAMWVLVTEMENELLKSNTDK